MNKQAKYQIYLSFILCLNQTNFELRSRLLKLGRLNEFIYARKNATFRLLPDGYFTCIRY